MRKAPLVIFLSFIKILSAGQTPIDAAQKQRLHGDYAGAEQTLRAALQSAGGSNRSFALDQLGDLLREEDRLSEAQPLFAEALKIESGKWETKFSALVGLADIDRRTDNWDRSLDEWTQSRSLAESHNNSLLVAVSTRGLGETWMDRGNLSRAEPLLKKAVAILQEDSHAPGFRVATALDSLASLYRLEQKTSMAEELWDRELQIDRKVMGEYHPQTALVMGHLAEAWAADGDFDRARQYSRQVIDIMESHFQHDSAAVASALVNDGVIEQHARNFTEAANRYLQALAIMRATSETGSYESTIQRLYQSAVSHSPHSKGSKQINAFMKNK